jgi:hypothetical protein
MQPSGEMDISAKGTCKEAKGKIDNARHLGKGEFDKKLDN